MISIPIDSFFYGIPPINACHTVERYCLQCLKPISLLDSTPTCGNSTSDSLTHLLDESVWHEGIMISTVTALACGLVTGESAVLIG